MVDMLPPKSILATTIVLDFAILNVGMANVVFKNRKEKEIVAHLRGVRLGLELVTMSVSLHTMLDSCKP